MANPNFDGLYSTNQIWRNLDEDRCLTDDLDAIESDISALNTGKAEVNHTHSGYAEFNHTHTGYAPAEHAHDGYATTAHTHSDYAAVTHEHTGYAAASHEHTEYAANGHEHDLDDVEGLEEALAEKANANHTHLAFSGNSANTYKQVYVGPEGNDENDGTQVNPMATIREAIRKFAEGYKYLDIRLLDGTYNEDMGAIGTDVTNLSIRSASENKDAVIINTATQLDLNSGHVRLYNMTINVTETGIRCISVNGGALYAYGIRVNVPEASTTSCINVYNGAQAFLMHCVLNSGTAAASGAAVYGNQALLIKAINCTSERTVNTGFHAHNGTDIWYTDTITATTKTKETYYGKCTVRA